MSDVTRILDRVHRGEEQAAEELLPLVYEELRRLAAAQMAQQPPGQTLQPTALVHEAWLKLVGHQPASWNDHTHFFRSAAQAMRQVLVDRARAKQRDKRGASPRHVNLDEVDLASSAEPASVLLVDEALQALEREHPDEAALVKLRFYMGLSVPETARALGVSEKTVKRQWTHARAWLFREANRLLQS